MRRLKTLRSHTAPGDLLTVEDTTIDPAASGTGRYTVHAVYYAAHTINQHRGNADLELEPATPPAAPTLTSSTAPPPSYRNFAAPSRLGESAGEPTIGGANKNGAGRATIILQSGGKKLFAAFD
jgi:hypothetical protein